MLIVTGIISVPPTDLAAFVAELDSLSAATRLRDGALSYHTAVLDADAGRLLVAERWRDQATLTAHLDANDTRAFVNRWQDRMSGDIRTYEAFDVGEVGVVAADTPANSYVSIVDFEPRHSTAFAALNIEWLERYFAIEDKDRAQIENAQAAIIDEGGTILIAEDEAGEAIGCVALIPYRDGELELAKMAVSHAAQGCGVGRKLMDAAITRAREMGARSIYLESNTKLTPAVTLYERSGFRHLAPEERVASPYVRCDVYMRRTL